MSSCAIKRVNRVRPAICRTSQPLQTGFSPDLDERGDVANAASGNGSAAGGIDVSGGSNCGFSGDDKTILSSTANSAARPQLALGPQLRGRPYYLTLLIAKLDCGGTVRSYTDMHSGLLGVIVEHQLNFFIRGKDQLRSVPRFVVSDGESSFARWHDIHASRF